MNGPGPGPIGSRVHVVNVDSAADHVILDGRSLWEAVAYSGRQIYLIHREGGLWALDASTGKIDQLAAPDAPVPSDPSPGPSQHMWAMIGPDAAWASDPQGGLARFDFAAKTVSVWFTVPTKMLRPIGLDTRGFPIVEGDANYSVAGSSRGGAWLVTAPQVAVQIAPDSAMIDGTLADSNGVWILSFETIYLWMIGGQLTQIAALSGLGPHALAGPCH